MTKGATHVAPFCHPERGEEGAARFEIRACAQGDSAFPSRATRIIKLASSSTGVAFDTSIPSSSATHDTQPRYRRVSGTTTGSTSFDTRTAITCTPGLFL